MSSERRRWTLRAAHGRAWRIRCAVACATWAAACGRGISLDPMASDPQNDKLDAADVSDADRPDVLLDAATTDTTDEHDVFSPWPDVLWPDVPPQDDTDAHSDATETDGGFDASPDAGPDGPDGFEDAYPDSDGGIEDVRDAPLDASHDAPFDVAIEAGDGCTVGCGWPEADYYVSARASSDGNGSKLEPFKTITLAIAAYRESSGQPKTAYVAEGTYDAALGEHFPLALRGLSLKGAGRAQTLIVGTGALDHAPEGGAFHDQYLVTLVAGDSVLTTAISDLSVRSDSPVPVSNHYGVFCDRGSATGEVAPPAGQTVLERLEAGPGYHASVLATTSTVPAVTGCNIVVRSSTLTGGWAGLRAYGCDAMRLSGPVLVEMGGPDPAHRNVVSWMQAPNDSAAGASLEGCVLRGSFENNAFSDSVYGIFIADSSVPYGTLGARTATIKNNSFERLKAGGIVVGTSMQVDELSDNRFVGITRGLSQDPGPRAIALSVALTRLGKARRNQFIGNDFGVLLRVPSGSGGQPADFGTAGDLGNNVFRCNSALKETGADFSLTGDGNANVDWAGTIHLAGNAWDHAPPTQLTVDPMPNGSDVSMIRVPNVILDVGNSSLATSECPTNRVPGQ